MRDLPTKNMPAVVLGAAVWKGGRPGPSLKRRVVHAVTLVKSGDAGWLIMTGGVCINPPAEAEVMKSLAVAKGIADSQILTEDKSTSTLESAVFCSDLLKANGWNEAWIVTDAFHLPRTLLLFSCFGIRGRPSCPDRTGKGTVRSHWIYLWLREVCALPWALLQVLAIHIGVRKRPVRRT
jgi:uncharacterized SAM-binding protein YcdF (DUF218 family)